MDSRIKRLEKTLDKKLSEKKAVHDIEKQDRERAQYYNTFTGKKWLDLRQYDLVLDTSPLPTRRSRIYCSITLLSDSLN